MQLRLCLKCWICAFLIFCSCVHSKAQEIYPLTVVTQQGRTCFDVELADTIWSRANGLMHRDDLEHSSGMVFLYDSETPVSFWMKNVPFPLDLIFISKTGAVVKIHQNAKPFDLMPIASKLPVSAVLEIRGGVSKSAQITVGDFIDMKHVASRTIANCLSIKAVE